MQGLINRRYLRVKAFQALYAFDAANRDQEVGEKNMLKSIDHVYALYLYMIDLILAVGEMAERQVDQNRAKRLATEEDLNPNMRFVENEVLGILKNNEELSRMLEKHKINWSVESDNVKKLWKKIQESEAYQDYMALDEANFQADKTTIIQLFKEHMAEDEVLHDYLEDKSIYWYSDLSLACTNVVKTLNTIKATSTPATHILLPLFKEQKEDSSFVKNLFHRSIQHAEDIDIMIDKHTKNWEVDRIARLDILMLRMAVCELLFFNEVPVKVTMNEYIELAKDYSTPNSKLFINGVLDKIVAQLKSEDRIAKTGRGLL